MNSPQVSERSLAVFIMGHIGLTDPLPLALRDLDPMVRKAAALAIGNAKNVQFVGLLTGALTDSVWFVRVAAAEGLKRLGDPVSLKALEARLDDEHPVVQNAVKSAIDTLSANALFD